MTQRRFYGIIPPTITALDADEQLDRAGMARLVEYQIQGGVHGLFVLGSNGEGPCLRDNVRQAVCEAAVEVAGGRVPVIAGVLQPSTARIIDDMRLLRDTGVAAFVATAPYYFGGYSTDELVEHFRRLADATDLPILIYNIPQTTKVSIKADAVIQIAEDPRIAGIKDSSGAWPEVQRLILERPREDFVILQGNQQMGAISLMLGADGLVPGFANVHPRLIRDLYDAVQRGDTAGALERQATWDRFIRIRGRATLHGTKLLAAHLGLIKPNLTAPLPTMTSEEAKRYLDACLAAGFPSRTPAAVS
ncbi:MAG: dihydrodipicolinate synthase family protein [Chloroflexi bacterium]|nr:dihydrodipicolinate synthase family protein [Chloroflexota bacterium]